MGCDVMKKLIASSLPRMHNRDKSSPVRTEGFRFFGMNGLLKLWYVGIAVLLATLLVGLSSPVSGQAVNATLLGTVADSSGAAVGNVKVTITETNTGITRNSQTNESGNYVFPDLPPGTYTVIVEQTGFKKATRTGIDVVVNTSVRVDL